MTTANRSHRSALIGLGACLLLASNAGCAARQKTKPWTPQPRVFWEDLAVERFPAPLEGYVILAAPTEGLFPADVAVARVTIENEQTNAWTTRCPKLAPEPRNEYLQWNAAFDNLMAVSEVFPVAQRDLGGTEAHPLQVLAAYRALGARMGLIYAMNELRENEVEMFGAWYDMRTTAPIAVCYARAVTTPPPEEASDRDRTDLWKTDAKALVRADFERVLHACMRELIRSDRSAPLEDTAGWKPIRPVRPAEWPPRHFASPPDKAPTAP